MCFNKVHTGKYKNIQVADKDIMCYKVLYARYYGIAAPYQDTVYFDSTESTEPVTKEIQFTKYHHHFTYITTGLHSYSNRRYAKDNWGKDTVYNAIIPKGTRYYYNPADHTYVSEKLTVFPKDYKKS